MSCQSEFNFLRLQIYITEHTFVYVLRCMLTNTTCSENVDTTLLFNVNAMFNNDVQHGHLYDVYATL